jgi:hypothetical protein
VARPKRTRELAPTKGTVELARELSEHVLKLKLAPGDEWSPFMVLAEIAASRRASDGDRIRAAAELGKYLRSQMRSVDVQSSHQERIEIVFTDGLE